MTHLQRTKRRKKMAEEVQRLMARKIDPEECLRRVSDKHLASIATVRGACREHGVNLPRKFSPVMAMSSLEIIAELQAGRRGTDIAKERGISRQRVDQIRRQAEQAGLVPPGPRRRTQP
jgi:hypothetical protein